MRFWSLSRRKKKEARSMLASAYTFLQSKMRDYLHLMDARALGCTYDFMHIRVKSRCNSPH